MWCLGASGLGILAPLGMREHKQSRALEIWFPTDLGALYTWSRAAVALTVPLGRPEGQAFGQDAAMCQCLKKQLSLCSEGRQVRPYMGLMCYPNCPLGEDDKLHAIAAKTTRAVLICQTGSHFVDMSSRDSQKSLALSPFISTWLCARDFCCSFTWFFPAFSTQIHSFGQSQLWWHESINSSPGWIFHAKRVLSLQKSNFLVPFVYSVKTGSTDSKTEEHARSFQSFPFPGEPNEVSEHKEDRLWLNHQPWKCPETRKKKLVLVWRQLYPGSSGKKSWLMESLLFYGCTQGTVECWSVSYSPTSVILRVHGGKTKQERPYSLLMLMISLIRMIPTVTISRRQNGMLCLSTQLLILLS